MSSKEYSKKLAEYMKKGWTIVDIACPICGTPLLKKDEKYFCAICEREVYVVENEKEALSILERDVLNKIKRRILERMNELHMTSDFRKIEDLKLLKYYLEILKELK